MAALGKISVIDQILTNAQMALKKQPGPEEATANVNGPGHGNGKGTGSQATLIPYASKSEMEVVVYGQRKDFKAVVMVGVTPVIESAARDNPEAAIHNLFLTTADILDSHMPKLGKQQRAVISTGGAYDPDEICTELKNAPDN